MDTSDAITLWEIELPLGTMKTSSIPLDAPSDDQKDVKSVAVWALKKANTFSYDDEKARFLLNVLGWIAKGMPESSGTEEIKDHHDRQENPPFVGPPFPGYKFYNALSAACPQCSSEELKPCSFKEEKEKTYRGYHFERWLAVERWLARYISCEHCGAAPSENCISLHGNVVFFHIDRLRRIQSCYNEVGFEYRRN